MIADVSIITPTIPTRPAFLAGAYNSVLHQTVQPAVHSMVMDLRGDGAAPSRNRALRGVTTEWVSFLDDDDWLYPKHLEKLLGAATNADVVYSGWDPPQDVFQDFGQPFSAEKLRERNYIAVTFLARTKLIQRVGGFPTSESPDWRGANEFKLGSIGGTMEDWGLLLRLLDAGARFAYVPERTWHYRRHRGSTSGRPWTIGSPW